LGIRRSYFTPAIWWRCRVPPPGP